MRTRNFLICKIFHIILAFLCLPLFCMAAQDGGYVVTSELWMKAVLKPSAGDVTLIWKEVGTDTTPSGDKVVSGYFYADPDDFAYGSQYNPEIFVKVYIASNGWANIAFNHVTVDKVDVNSAYKYTGNSDKYSIVSITNRLAEHQYNGVLPANEALKVEPSEPYYHSDGEVYKNGSISIIEVSNFGSNTVANIEIADLDQDGDIDLILGSEENHSIIQVYENMGDAVFRNSGCVFPFQSPEERHWNFGIAVQDFNGDTLLDIATADAWAGLNIYLNQGNMRFLWVQNYTFKGMGEVKGIYSADFNNDGLQDIVLGDHNGQNRGDRILLNDGSGNMIDTGQSIGWDITWDVFAIDINRDSAIDYISVNRYGYEPTRIHFNNGDGVFANTFDIPNTFDDSSDVKAFYYSDHTYCFIANSAGESDRRNRVFVFNEMGELAYDQNFGQIGDETKDMKLVDFNGDGLFDLVTANWNSGGIAYLSVPGASDILDLEKVPLFDINSMTAIGSADFNGDGLLDFIAGFEDINSSINNKKQYKLLLQLELNE